MTDANENEDASGRQLDQRVIRVIVCAAVRNKETGAIVCGVRHGHCFNAVMLYGLDGRPNGETWECGFVDQNNRFLTREEAWRIADAAGQIRRPTGFEKNFCNQRASGVGDDGMLFSENLY